MTEKLPNGAPQDNESDVSLAEVHGTVDISEPQSFWRRFFAFAGPAFMVSVGYMDPGNWATDIAGGARFGYRLIWIILLSNLMAIIFQTLSARLGIATGRDLAQACREYYPRPVTWVLWIICEIAIAACDLAEVLGSAIGLHLLFKIPLLFGVILTAFDVMLLLMLQSYGIRKLEAAVVAMVATIGTCFALEMLLSKPVWTEVAKGLLPSALSGDALYIAIGIIGATVMPHNLYLHSALVQTRALKKTPEGLRQASWFNLLDCVVAMNGAFFVNTAILVLAATTFHFTGHGEVASIQEAYALLDPLLGSRIAPIAFAVALLAAGQSSTITGTLAGQIVMEGFVRIRLRPWMRRLLTRLLAIIPAILVILIKGDDGIDSLLILSQVILSLQLAFALVPLIHFTRDRRWMGILATPTWIHLLAWLSAGTIIVLNLKMVFETIIAGFDDPGIDGQVIRCLLVPATACLLPLLFWMIFEGRWKQFREQVSRISELPDISSKDLVFSGKYQKIGIAIEATHEDMEVVSHMFPLAKATGAQVILIHALESATGRFIGPLADDAEARAHSKYLEIMKRKIVEGGLVCDIKMGTGEAENEIARIAKEEKVDLIVTGSHGHSLWGNLIYGSTISELRKLTNIPIFSIRVSGNKKVFWS